MKNQDRRPWLGGNWKMYKTVPEAMAFARDLLAALPRPLEIEVVIAPPFTALRALAGQFEHTPVQLAGQNLHWVEEGAYTGEIAPRMLKDVGCTYCLVGHSERRHWFGETDDQVRKKIQACLKAGLAPVLCLGETLEERDQGRVEEVVGNQLQEAFQDLTEEQAGQGVIAYEPVWAIGTGRAATPEAAQEVHAFIREWLGRRFNKNLAKRKRIVYGGSVTPENIADLYAQPDIDGGLVGGASLKPEKFLALIKGLQR